MTPKLTEAQAKTKKFAELVLTVKHLTGKAQPEIVSELASNDKYGKRVSTESLIKYMIDLGIVAPGGETEQVAAVQQEPEPSLAASYPSQAQPVEAEAKEQEVPELSIDLFRDENGRLLNRRGEYVCPLCVRDGLPEDEIYTSDSIRGIGPHAKAHENKDRGWVEDLIPTLPLISEVADESEEPAAAHPPTIQPVPQEVPVDEEHRTLSDREEPKTSELETILSGVSETQLPDPSPIQPMSPSAFKELQEYIVQSEERILDRMEKLETVVANLMVVLLSLDENARKALYDKFAKDKISMLAEIISKEI